MNWVTHPEIITNYFYPLLAPSFGLAGHFLSASVSAVFIKQAVQFRLSSNVLFVCFLHKDISVSNCDEECKWHFITAACLCEHVNEVPHLWRTEGVWSCLNHQLIKKIRWRINLFFIEQWPRCILSEVFKCKNKLVNPLCNGDAVSK